MRRQAYWLFEVVAWPATAWGAFECVVRVATGTTAGLGAAALLAALAGITIVACRWRQANLPVGRGGGNA